MLQSGDQVWDDHDPVQAADEYESLWRPKLKRFSYKKFDFEKNKSRRKIARMSRRKNR